jgi:chaperonin GroEL
MLDDLAALTGGTVVSDERGITLADMTIDMLGSAEKIEITKDKTTVINGAGEKQEIEARIKKIRAEIEAVPSDYEKEKLQERLAKLAGGVAVLYIGAPTETEMKEKKDRVDDALAATRAAVEEGVVPGGGVALVRCISSLDALKGANEDENVGIQIVKRAIEEPLRQIVANAGGEGAVIVQRVKEGKDAFGYNARTDEFVDMLKAGIIDPTKVTRTAIENAASIASMLLMTECVIVDEPTENEMDMPGGMPGMM